MTVETIERDFREKVGRKVRLASEGMERFRVFTPFLFDDGDHLSIILRRDHNRWTLTDEGHTFMHLTYEIDEKSLSEGTRNKIITTALDNFGITDAEGELRIDVPEERFGDALFTFVQGLLKITDVRFLSRERVKSAFWEDFVGLLSEVIPDVRRQFDYNDPDHDPDAKYVVDCRINHLPRPVFVYAIPGDDKCRDATISLLQFERWGVPNHSVAIYEDQQNINRSVVARFSDVCGKQFSSLGANRDRITKHLKDEARIN